MRPAPKDDEPPTVSEQGITLRQDRRATSALEFGLVAPAMVFLIYGTIELSNAFRIQAKVNVVAGQLAELVAGQQSVTAPGGTLTDLCNGAALNLAPYSQAPLAADITSLTNLHPADESPGNTDTSSINTWVDWENVTSCPTASTAVGGAAIFNDANYPLSLLTRSGAPATGPNGSTLQYRYSAIVVTVTYPYTNVLPFSLGKLLTFKAVAMARPRTNTTVKCNNPTSAAPCPQLQ